MSTWIILLLLLWPLFWLLRVLLVTRLLMGLEFCTTRVKALAPAEIPPHLQEAAKPWLIQLQSLGFRRLGGWRLNSTTEAAFDDHAIVLEKDTQVVRAVIQVYGESARSGECWVSLRTTKHDGTELITASHAPEELLPLAPGIEIEVIEAASPEDLVQRHLARISTGAEWWRCPDIASAATREQHVRDASLGQAHAENNLTESADGVFSYRAGAALRRAARILRRAAEQKKNRRPSQRSVAATLSAESQLEFDLQHYRQQGALRRGRFSLKAKTVITCVSFLLFAGVLAWQYSPVVAVTLLVALIIHECGHLLGMRWFGYRDTQLLFVPFFGGAAIGHDDKVLPAWKHIVIILLGPLPGIFLALVMLVYASGGGAPAWVTMAAVTILVLNAFNLLPILPLDGGQVVDYAVASRFPRVRVLFLALSALGLLLCGLGLGGTRILFGLGVATLIRLPVEWRLAGLRRAIREQFPDGGEEEPIVRSLITEMREPEWKKPAMSQRLQMVRGLQQVLRMPPPGLGTMVFALIGFTAPFWLGAPLAVWAVGRQGDAQVAQAHARAVAAGLGTVPVGLKASEVTAEENAAVPYEQAGVLARGESAEEDSASPAKNEQIVALLRTAAHRRVFVPSAAASQPASRPTFAAWGRAGLVSHLTSAATERLRYKENAEAAALAIDALKLLRLMQAAPGVLNWPEYKFVADSAWNTVEEVLATGATLPSESIAELRRLCAEAPEIVFATAAIPRGLLEQADAADRMDLFPGRNLTGQFLHLLQRVNPVWTRMQIEAIDQAIVAQGLLEGIARGEWPRPVAAAPGARQRAMASVAQLGDFIARKRQANVALRLIEQRQRGLKITSLKTLAATPAELVHPLTRVPMQLTRRGSLDVLSFADGAARVPDSEDAEDGPSLLWRLPGEHL